MEDNNKNKKVFAIKVEFKRKNKSYMKDIYLIMTEDMIQNIQEKDNVQYLIGFQ